MQQRNKPLKLLVVSEKHGRRFFIPGDSETFLEPFIAIIRERLEDGYWYEDQFKEQAENLIQWFDELMEEGPVINRPIDEWCKEEEELLKAVTKFLEKRRRYEYEEWEICTTEN